MGRYINKLGIEIECGVSDQRDYTEPPEFNGFECAHDGSLRRKHSDYPFLREYISRPFKYQEEIPELKDKVEQIYNHITETNSTMGLHVHISTTKNKFTRGLLTKRFTDFFVDEIEKSDLWKHNRDLRHRLRGVNYSRTVTQRALRQMLVRKAGRYYHINFDSLRQHGTVEFRVFPSYSEPEGVYKSIDLVTRTVNKWLMKKDYKLKLSENLKETPEVIKYV